MVACLYRRRAPRPQGQKPIALRNLRNNELQLFEVLTVVGDRASPTIDFCVNTGLWRVVRSKEVPFERASAHQECWYDRKLLSHLSRYENGKGGRVYACRTD